MIEYVQIDASRRFQPRLPSQMRLSEYQGSPVELAEHMTGVEILAVHGAPVSEDVLAASSGSDSCAAREADRSTSMSRP